MCRVYHNTKRKGTFTRLCYRYRDLRGQHVQGDHPCGTYPRPNRRGTAPAAGPITPKPICPECRRPAPTRGRPCDDCAITQQLRDLPDQVLEAAARNNPRDTHLTAELARRRAA